MDFRRASCGRSDLNCDRASARRSSPYPPAVDTLTFTEATLGATIEVPTSVVTR
jgi:hypothetical protein